MCECQDMSMDLKTPRNVYLSAFYKRSFAYHTVKNRMPIIITQLIDNLSRGKDEIIKQYGQEASDDIKKVMSELSKFKYEVQTNKPLTKLISNEPDIAIYNDYIAKQAAEEGETTHFNTIWLLTECYMYTRIKQIFSQTNVLKDFDYFQTSKIEAFHKSNFLMQHLAEFINNVYNGSEKLDMKNVLVKMFKINLWGNKCDLSISLGKVDGPGDLHETDDLEPFILSDNTEAIVNDLLNSTADIIDIVLDNSGYEVFTDMCLAEVLLTSKVATKVRFHVKSIPWFISDVMEHDFHWTLDQLASSQNDNLSALGNRWKKYVAHETWSVHIHSFWTLPYEFKFMEQFAPELFKLLAKSKLIIFKGDLNYRKLFGERNWDPITTPEEALQGFWPNKLCTLRTIKADIVVGLKPGVAEECERKDAKWMETGNYGLMQYVNKAPRKA